MYKIKRLNLLLITLISIISFSSSVYGSSVEGYKTVSLDKKDRLYFLYLNLIDRFDELSDKINVTKSSEYSNDSITVLGFVA